MEAARNLIGKVTSWFSQVPDEKTENGTKDEAFKLPTPQPGDLDGSASNLANRISGQQPQSELVARVENVAEPIAKRTEVQIITEFLGVPESALTTDLANPLRATVAIIKADQSKPVSGVRGHTLFLELAASSDPDIRKLAGLCLDRGADPLAKSKEGKTALHYAVMHDDTALTQRVLSACENQEITAKEALDHLPDFVNSNTGNIFLKQLSEQDWSPLSEQLLMELVLRGHSFDFQMAGERALIERVLAAILGRSFQGPQDAAFVEKILEMRDVTALTYEGKSFLGALGRCKHLPQPLQPRCQGLANEEVIEALEVVVDFDDYFVEAQADFFRLNRFIEEMKGPIQILRNSGMTFCQSIGERYEGEAVSKFNVLKAKLDKFLVQVGKDPTLLEAPEDFLGPDTGQLAKYLLFVNRFDLLKQLIPQEHIDRGLFHLLLDKMGWDGDNRYAGMSPPVALSMVRVALEKAVQPSWEYWDGPLHEQKNRLINETLPLLAEGTELSCLQTVQKFAELGKRVASRVASLKVGEKILLPSASAHHATLLLAERTSEQTVKLVHYDVGEGLGPERRLNGTQRYQTFNVIEGIPHRDLVDEKRWIQLFSLADFDDMEGINQFIQMELGRNGKSVPLSEATEDYEAIQLQGTCTFQSVMAFLRHQIMDMDAGSKGEKLAAYKLIKAKMILLYAQENEPKATNEIRKVLVTPVVKLEAEEKLAKLAIDEKAYQEAVKSFGEFLRTVGQEPLAKQLALAKAPVERLALLRKASASKASHWLDNMIDPEGVTDSDVLAVARLNHHMAIADHYLGLIAANFEDENGRAAGLDGLLEMITASSLPSLGLAAVTRFLNPDRRSYQDELAVLVTALKPRRPDMVPLLAQAYRRYNLEEAAQLVESVASQKK